MSTIPTPESDRTLIVEFLFDTEAACIGSFDYINRWGGLRIGDSIIKIVSASRAIPRNKDDIYQNSSIRSPEYPRQQIISEKWTTDIFSPACVIDANNKIWDFTEPMTVSGSCVSFQYPIAVAPTKEFIDEILLIHQGKWIPLEGDWYCEYCNTCECVHKGLDSGTWSHDQTPSPHYSYFPSIEQRDKRMSKNKPTDTSIAGIADYMIGLHSDKVIPREEMLAQLQRDNAINNIPGRQQKPVDQSWGRGQILREEWEPSDGEMVLIIDKYNIVKPAYYWAKNKEYYKSQYESHAPTRELALEIVSIRQGEWIPEKDDEYFILDNGKEDLAFDGNIAAEGKHLYRGIKNINYFPSAKQRSTYKASLPTTTPQIAQDGQTQPSPYKDVISDGFSDVRIPTVDADNLTIPDLVKAIDAYRRKQALEEGEWDA